MIQPIGHRVLVQHLAPERQTETGIYIAETAAEHLRRGKVLQVGTGDFQNGKRLPLDVKEGETIIFQNGDKVEDDLYIVHHNDILGSV